MVFCSLNDKIKELSEYLSNTFSAKPENGNNYVPISENIPIIIKNNYDIVKSNILGIDVCYMLENGNANVTPAVLKKHQDLLSKNLETHTIAVLNNLTGYNQNRMIKTGVNFIVPNRIMFVPSLLIEIQKPRMKTDLQSKQITPIAQCIILYHLEKNSLNGKKANDLCEIFKVSYANINRALKWLNDNKLITLSGSKTQKMEFRYNAKELWENTKDLMTSPIEKTMFTDSIIEGHISGENALSELTMLSEPNRHCIAISKELVDRKQLDKEYGDHIVEIWKYNPALLSENKVVDKLSLYLSLRNNEDERIQTELDNLIDSIKW